MIVESFNNISDALQEFEYEVEKIAIQRGLKISVSIKTDASGKYRGSVEVPEWSFVPLYYDGERNFEREEPFPYGINTVEISPTDKLTDTLRLLLEEIKYIVWTYDKLKLKEFKYEKVFEL